MQLLHSGGQTTHKAMYRNIFLINIYFALSWVLTEEKKNWFISTQNKGNFLWEESYKLDFLTLTEATRRFWQY